MSVKNNFISVVCKCINKRLSIWCFDITHCVWHRNNYITAFIRLCLAHNDAVRDEIEAKNRYDNEVRAYQGHPNQDVRIAFEKRREEADATLLDLQESYSRLIMRFPELKDDAQTLLTNLPDRSNESRSAWNKGLSVFRETVTSLYARNERKSLLTWCQRRKKKG